MASVAYDFIPPDYLPLRRAVARVGPRIFPDRWVATESFLDEEDDRLRKIFDLSRSIAIADSDRRQNSDAKDPITELGAPTRSELDSDFDQMIHSLREIEYIRVAHGKTYEEIEKLTLGQRLAFRTSTPVCVAEMLAWDEAQTRHILFEGPDPGPQPEHPLPELPKLRAKDYDEFRRRFEREHRFEMEAWDRMARVVTHLRNWLYSERIPACVLETDGRKIAIGSNFWATGIIPDLVFQTGQMYCIVGPAGELTMSQDQPSSRRARFPGAAPRKAFVLESALNTCLDRFRSTLRRDEGRGSCGSRGTAGGESRCQSWLETLMRQGSQESAKRKYFAEAQQNFAISRRGFDRAWASAIKITGKKAWSRPGRKS